MGSITWGREWAEAYDAIYSGGSERSVLDPMVDLLAELAQGRAALEFGSALGVWRWP